MEQLDKEAAEYKAMLADLDAEEKEQEKEQAIADGKKLRDDAEKKAAEEADKRKAEALKGKDENVSKAL
jgi:F0F1-type ATP synthase membrane subunit b/b'